MFGAVLPPLLANWSPKTSASCPPNINRKRQNPIDELKNFSSDAGEKNFGGMDYPRPYSNSRHKRAVFKLKSKVEIEDVAIVSVKHSNILTNHNMLQNDFSSSGIKRRMWSRVVVTLRKVYCEGIFNHLLSKAVFFRMQAEFRSSASSRVYGPLDDSIRREGER
ncbi:hypothetical protein TNIN_471341 [Trichonephila inaurata madagascariensis]|uniref:Uncharacterized protein n=1 Tax=Trichonephila inaurata madagascariensis TaxID=2747483 RepID=A0A8X7CRG2_9ARAC|nr:hypothetical protein TNIN_471341 [Trichonephila inaurata madagascariensis]